MAKIKKYHFKDGSVFTSNSELVAAIGESPHVRQVSVNVNAPSKAAALEYLFAVGIARFAKESHLGLVDPRNISEDDEIIAGTVTVSPMIPSRGRKSVTLTPTDNPSKPTITVVKTY